MNPVAQYIINKYFSDSELQNVKSHFAANYQTMPTTILIGECYNLVKTHTNYTEENIEDSIRECLQELESAPSEANDVAPTKAKTLADIIEALVKTKDYFALAELFLNSTGYKTTNSILYEWDNNHYRTIDTSDNYDDTFSSEFSEWVLKVTGRNNLNSDMTKQHMYEHIAKSFKRQCRISPKDIDPRLVYAFNNRTIQVDKITGDIQTIDKHQYFITKPLPYNYPTDLLTTKFDAFLEMICTNRSGKVDYTMIDIIWEIIALCVTGNNPRVQKYVFLYGDGRNGKSAIFETIKMLIPKMCAVTSFNSLTDPNNMTYAADLTDKHCILASDHEVRKYADMGRLNALTGDSDIEVRVLYKNPKRMELQLMPVMALNEIPIIRKNTAFMERLIFVQFWQKYLGNDAIINIHHTWKDELGAIMLKALKWHAKILRNNHHLPVLYTPAKTRALFGRLGVNTLEAAADMTFEPSKTTISYKELIMWLSETLKNSFDADETEIAKITTRSAIGRIPMIANARTATKPPRYYLRVIGQSEQSTLD